MRCLQISRGGWFFQSLAMRTPGRWPFRSAPRNPGQSFACSATSLASDAAGALPAAGSMLCGQKFLFRRRLPAEIHGDHLEIAGDAVKTQQGRIDPGKHNHKQQAKAPDRPAYTGGDHEPGDPSRQHDWQAIDGKDEGIKLRRDRRVEQRNNRRRTQAADQERFEAIEPGNMTQKEPPGQEKADDSQRPPLKECQEKPIIHIEPE